MVVNAATEAKAHLSEDIAIRTHPARRIVFPPPRCNFLSESSGIPEARVLLVGEMSNSEQMAAAHGDEGGRMFAAHATLDRVRSSRGAEALTSGLRSPMNPPPGGRLAVDRADLARSELGPGGPGGTVLREPPLKG